MKKDREIKRPTKLPCEVYHFLKGERRWICFAGLKDDLLFEVFLVESATKRDENDDHFFIPDAVDKGVIVKVEEDGVKRYDFKYKDKHNFSVTLEGLNRVLDVSYFNYVINTSFMLRKLPNDTVIHVIKKWQKLDEKQKQMQEILIEIISKYVR